MMRRFDASALSVRELHHLMIGGIGPRPIALVSTRSESGVNNLSPFSFFNAFGSNPPVIAFSPARRGTTGEFKDTYHNLMATRECVVQVVTHAMVEQANVASTEFPPEVDEFEMSGLTPIPSHQVKPMRVKESPFQMECELMQMIPLGAEKASGNLAICRVLMFHVADHVMSGEYLNPTLLDLVGRNGGNWYTRASGSALFEVRKPGFKVVGFPGIPAAIREHRGFTANDLGKFAALPEFPSLEQSIEWVDQAGPSDLLGACRLALDSNEIEDAAMMARVALEARPSRPR